MYRAVYTIIFLCIYVVDCGVPEFPNKAGLDAEHFDGIITNTTENSNITISYPCFESGEIIQLLHVPGEWLLVSKSIRLPMFNGSGG